LPYVFLPSIEIFLPLIISFLPLIIITLTYIYCPTYIAPLFIHRSKILTSTKIMFYDKSKFHNRCSTIC
jgi:hypothetical protein